MCLGASKSLNRGERETQSKKRKRERGKPRISCVARDSRDERAKARGEEGRRKRARVARFSLSYSSVLRRRRRVAFRTHTPARSLARRPCPSACEHRRRRLRQEIERGSSEREKRRERETETKRPLPSPHERETQAAKRSPEQFAVASQHLILYIIVYEVSSLHSLAAFQLQQVCFVVPLLRLSLSILS